MKIYISTLALILALFSGVQAMATESTNNAIKAEMILLDKAFKNAIDGLILNKPEIIEHPFHEVHAAKMATEKAIKKGDVRLPKNGDKMEEFIQMDEVFHDKLRTLLRATRKKDMGEVKNAINDIMDGCVECHNKYRN